MSFSSVEVYAKEYFHTLNPIAQRISSDVRATRDAYEDLWITLSYKDQRQVLDETIIHPEAILKYSFFPKNEPEVEYFPRLRIQTGEKYVTDDEGGKGNGFRWRDEHSAPFSFMTRSQLNLNLDGQPDSKKTPGTSPKPRPTPKKAAPQPPDGFLDPPSIVLGGSSSKMAATTAAGGSRQLKFPPKADGDNAGGNLLSRLKSKTAVLKIQSLKSAVTRSGDGGHKGTDAEKESLVQRNVNQVLPPAAKLSAKPKISKPKTPPPPPPKPRDQPHPPASPCCQADPERKALLQESPGDEVDVATLATLATTPPEQQVVCNSAAALEANATLEANAALEAKATQEANAMLEAKASLEVNATLEANNASLESLQEFHSALNSPTGSGSDDGAAPPKTGFDFLDNW